MFRSHVNVNAWGGASQQSGSNRRGLADAAVAAADAAIAAAECRGAFFLLATPSSAEWQGRWSEPQTAAGCTASISS